MNESAGSIGYCRLRAPREDGGLLVVPPLESAAALIASNRAAAQRCENISLQGRSLGQLAREGRTQMLHEAVLYTRAYRDVPDPPKSSGKLPPLVIIAGHQPQLFHPGVWFKNFLLSSLAARHSAAAVNLLIDSDTIKSASVRVLTGPVQMAAARNVELDRRSQEIPFEERAVIDRECLESFGRRAKELLHGLVPNPLLDEFWPLVIERSRTGASLGQCLAQARHQQEASFGGKTLELPQSRICELESFRWFAAWLVANSRRVNEVYNTAVADYRRVNRVRSAAHPVPDLAVDGDWHEVPLWSWSAGDPRRRRLFAKAEGNQMLLTDRAGNEYRLCLSEDADGRCAVEQLASLAAGGVKLRTRALATTLFARLVLGDLFLHGIGGAKYDQVTDAIIARLFGVEPPMYMTATATLRLPIDWPARASEADVDIDRELRELTYHPERWIAAGENAQADRLVAEKRRWVGEPQTTANARERCQAIRGVNEALQPWLAERRTELLASHGEREETRRAEAVLQSREYAFCFFPRESLQSLLQAESLPL